MTTKEAIEILREAHDNALFSVRTALETLIPELVDSKDEIIRKELLALVRMNVLPEATCLVRGGSVTRAQAEAYLEKQKESGIKWLKSDNVKNPEKPYIDKAGMFYTTDGRMCHASEIEKQKEQKVSVDDFKAKDWYVSKVDGKIHNIYYSVDKVKPKFKVGDKIIEKDFDECGRGTIIDIKDGKYIFDDGGFICIEEQGLWKLVEQKPADYNEYKMLIDGAREEGKITGRKEVLDNPKEYGLQKEQKPWKVGANAYFTPEQKPAEYLDKDKIYVIMKKLHNLSFSQDILINSKEYKQIDEITHDVRDLLNYPIEQKQEWSEDERKILDSIIDDYEAASKSFCGYDGKILVLKAIRDGNLPKPAWSEEDEEMLKCVIMDVESAKEDYLKSTTEVVRQGAILADKELAWLKSLRPQPLKLEDWTEEDEELLKDVLGCITLVQTYKATGLLKEFKTNFTGEELRSFVRSLKSRPRKQPRWRPNEEQMKALEDAFRKDGSDEYRRTINSLYQDLKKL